MLLKNYIKNLIKEELEKVKGGLADGKTLEDIAKKHNVPLLQIKKEFLKGVKIEMEHTNDIEVSKEITKDHLMELPDYYTRLQQVEKD